MIIVLYTMLQSSWKIFCTVSKEIGKAGLAGAISYMTLKNELNFMVAVTNFQNKISGGLWTIKLMRDESPDGTLFAKSIIKETYIIIVLKKTREPSPDKKQVHLENTPSTDDISEIDEMDGKLTVLKDHLETDNILYVIINEDGDITNNTKHDLLELYKLSLIENFLVWENLD